VSYEDLDDTPGGWMWTRWSVTLTPPDRWHAEALGNYRDWKLDYSLRSLADGRTELILRGRRRPAVLGKANPPKAELEGSLRKDWTQFGRALEADYRRSLRGPRRRATRPR
jgi:hypothetical protein